MDRDPPIFEVAITIQHQALQGQTIVDFVELYRSFESEFPTVQHAQRAQPIRNTPVDPIQFTLPIGADMPRIWFVSPDLAEVIQIQSDRYSHNWRRPGLLVSGRQYPGYAALREKFCTTHRRVTAWLHAHETACEMEVGELLYVNAIPLRDGPDGPIRRISEVLSFYSPSEVTAVANFAVTWWEQAEQVDGWVNVGINAAPMPDGTPAIHLRLTGTCNLKGSEFDTALQRLDHLHDHIRRTFTRLVKPWVLEGTTL